MSDPEGISHKAKRLSAWNLVDGTKVNGQVNINQENGYDRLSDLVSSSLGEFIVLNGATLYKAEIEDPSVKHKVLFVNKRHILWASPEEDQI